jgi:plasmid stability protein
MKATIDFDDDLYRRLKIEAARQGRTVREMVAEGVRYILDGEQGAETQPADATADTEWRPAWFGSLRRWAATVDSHDMSAIRESIARERADDSRP